MELIIIGFGALMGWSILFPGWVYDPPFGEFKDPKISKVSNGKRGDSCDGDVPVKYGSHEAGRTGGTPSLRTLRTSTRILSDDEHAEAAAALRRAARK